MAFDPNKPFEVVSPGGAGQAAAQPTSGGFDPNRPFTVEQQEPMQPVRSLLQGGYAGLSTAIDLPADAVKGLSRTVLDILGQESPDFLQGGSLRRGLAARGFTYNDMSELPQGERPFAAAGEVLGGSIPFAAAPLAAARAGVQGAGIMAPVMSAARSAPGTFAAVEAAGAAGAAQGAGIAEFLDPGDPTTRFLGEVAGGFAAPTSLAASAARGVVRPVRDAARSLTRAGREQKAGEYLNELLTAFGEDPQEVARLLRAGSLDDIPLTAGAQADSPALNALQRKLSDADARFGSDIRRQTMEGLDELRGLADRLAAQGDPEALRKAAEIRQKYFDGLLATRVRDAEQAAIQARARMGTEGRRGAEEASREAYEALSGAMKDARAVERELWSKVPRDEPLQPSGVLEAYAAARGSMLPEERLPGAIEPFIARMQKANQVPSGELLTFRSRMLEQARDARAQRDFSAARRYDELAEGALQDLNRMEGREVDEARAFSAAFHDRFSRTFAGDALGQTGTGAERIAPELMLERAFGSGGDRGALRMQQLADATAFPEGSGFVPQMMNAQERFLRIAGQEIRDPATGRVNPDRLAAFMERNPHIMDRFPALRRDFANVENAERALADVERSTQAASRIIQKEAAFAKLVGAEDPASVVRSTLSGRQPSLEYDRIARVARRGGEGAVDGLKSATLDEAFRQASRSGNLSFTELDAALNQPLSRGQPSVMQLMRRNGVITPKEQNRLLRIIEEGQKVERSLRGDARMNELVGEPSAMFDTLTRIIGANIGGMSAMGQSSGAPIVVAGAGSRAAQRIMQKVPATRLSLVLQEAVENPQFMAMLLERTGSPQRQRQLDRQINAFLLQAGIIPDEGEE